MKPLGWLDAFLRPFFRRRAKPTPETGTEAVPGSGADTAPAPPSGAAPSTDRPLGWWDRLWNMAFAINPAGAMRRRWGLLALFGGLWLGLVWLVWPDAAFRLGGGAWLSLASTFFAWSVWRVLLPFLLMGVYVFLWAAMYLDDIYELYDEAVAARFIFQAAFSSHYEVIEIKDGDVAPEYRASPVVRIGGPGRVIVHVENAAVFEKVDGTPHEIGPTAGTVRPGCLARLFPVFFRPPRAADASALLEGFERLRAVINLKPHQTRLNMQLRTREGVPVRLENVTGIYHIARYRQDSTLRHPYPFLPQALIQVVYNQEPPRVPGKRDIQHRDWVRFAERRLLRASLSQLVSQHSLAEFLTTTGKAETELLEQARREIQKQAHTFAETQLLSLVEEQAAESAAAEEPQADSEAKPRFLGRQDIRQRILDQARERMHGLGVTMEWSGLGTWQTPPEIVVENHLKAWYIGLSNRLRGSTEALERLRRQNQMGTEVRLIREISLAFRRRVSGSIASPERQVLHLLQDYLALLQPIADRLRRREQSNKQLAPLLRTVEYLRLIAREPPPSMDWVGGETEPS